MPIIFISIIDIGLCFNLLKDFKKRRNIWLCFIKSLLVGGVVPGFARPFLDVFLLSLVLQIFKGSIAGTGAEDC